MEVFKVFATFSLYDMISKPLTGIQAKLKAAKLEASGLTGSMITLGKKILPLAAASGLLLTAFASSVNAAAEFQTSMAKTSTMFKDIKVDTAKLNKDIINLSASTGVAAKEIGNALYEALSSGIPVTEDMASAVGFMDKNIRLAKAGFTDVNTALVATTSVLNAYNADISEVDTIHKILMVTQNNGITTIGELGQSLAQVTPIAAAMGVSFDQVGAALSNMTSISTPTAQAATQLKSIIAELGKNGTMANKNLMEAARGTEYAGMSFTDMMHSGVPLNKILDLMDEKAQANGRSLMDLFSSIEAGNGALNLAGANSQKYTDNLIAMSTSTDVVGDAYKKMSATLPEAMGRMGTSFGALKIVVGSLFIPVITVLADALSGVVKVLTTVASHPIGKLFLALIAVAAVATITVTLLVGAFLLLKIAMLSAAAMFAPFIAPILIAVAVLALLIAVWYNFKDQIIAVLSAIGNFLVGWFNLGMNLIKGYISYIKWGVAIMIKLFSIVIDFFKAVNLFESGKKLLLTFVQGILSVIEIPKRIVKNALQGIRDLLPFSDAKEGPLSTLTLSGSRMMTTLADGVDASAPNLKLSTDKALQSIDFEPRNRSQNSETNKLMTSKGDTHINISNINLPNVSDVQSFLDELRELKLSLGV